MRILRLTWHFTACTGCCVYGNNELISSQILLYLFCHRATCLSRNLGTADPIVGFILILILKTDLTEKKTSDQNVRRVQTDSQDTGIALEFSVTDCTVLCDKRPCKQQHWFMWSPLCGVLFVCEQTSQCFKQYLSLHAKTICRPPLTFLHLYLDLHTPFPPPLLFSTLS